MLVGEGESGGEDRRSEFQVRSSSHDTISDGRDLSTAAMIIEDQNLGGTDASRVFLRFLSPKRQEEGDREKNPAI